MQITVDPNDQNKFAKHMPGVEKRMIGYRQSWNKEYNQVIYEWFSVKEGQIKNHGHDQ